MYKYNHIYKCAYVVHFLMMRGIRLSVMEKVYLWFIVLMWYSTTYWPDRIQNLIRANTRLGSVDVHTNLDSTAFRLTGAIDPQSGISQEWLGKIGGEFPRVKGCIGNYNLDTMLTRGSGLPKDASKIWTFLDIWRITMIENTCSGYINGKVPSTNTHWSGCEFWGSIQTGEVRSGMKKPQLHKHICRG